MLLFYENNGCDADLECYLSVFEPSEEPNSSAICFVIAFFCAGFPLASELDLWRAGTTKNKHKFLSSETTIIIKKNRPSDRHNQRALASIATICSVSVSCKPGRTSHTCTCFARWREMQSTRGDGGKFVTCQSTSELSSALRNSETQNFSYAMCDPACDPCISQFNPMIY